jgi:hypothetical protein
MSIKQLKKKENPRYNGQGHIDQGSIVPLQKP